MLETMQSPEEKGLAVTSIDQLLAEYPKFHKGTKEGDVEQLYNKAKQKAEELIKDNGGLTNTEIESLGFLKKDEFPVNDI
ncbi:MAG: hypothetical protein Q8P20_06180 [bacterium]|nr:hypothetical protein [bacterium]